MAFQKSTPLLLQNWQKVFFTNRNHPENLVTLWGPLLAKTLTQKTTWIVQINFVVVTLCSWGNTQYVKGDQRICIISIYTIDLFKVFSLQKWHRFNKASKGNLSYLEKKLIDILLNMFYGYYFLSSTLHSHYSWLRIFIIIIFIWITEV